jgi:hypothetical protein
MLDIFWAIGIIICIVAAAQSLVHAAPFIRYGDRTGQRIGCKFLSESFLYVTLAIGTAGPFLNFGHDEWMTYRSVLLAVVIAGILTTFRLSRER